MGGAPAVRAQPSSGERQVGHRGGDHEQNREDSYKCNQNKHKFASQKNWPKIFLKNTWLRRASPANLTCPLASACVIFLGTWGLIPGMTPAGDPVAFVLGSSVSGLSAVGPELIGVGP